MESEELQARIDELEKKVKSQHRDLETIARERDSWKSSFEVYRSAWLREIGGVIRPKSHEIDGFVLRTRDLLEEAAKQAKRAGELDERLKKIRALCEAAK